jgi:hypothetical protein
MIPVPRMVWQRFIKARAGQIRAGIRFMSEDHHKVRDFAVTELPRAGGPLPPESIAGELDLPLDRVKTILSELEKRLTFLFRNDQGAVTWAYPVTVDETPHHASFSTGEEAYSP